MVVTTCHTVLTVNQYRHIVMREIKGIVETAHSTANPEALTIRRSGTLSNGE